MIVHCTIQIELQGELVERDVVKSNFKGKIFSFFYGTTFLIIGRALQ